MNFTDEMIEKAKTAASPDELLALAKEHGVDLTPDEAKTYFDYLSTVSDDALDGVSGGVPPHAAVRAMPGMPSEGALSDDELSNVSGGGCYNKGELVVTVGTKWCDRYECKHCKQTYWSIDREEDHNCNRTWTRLNVCGTCTYCKYKGGLWKCTHPKKRKG